MATDWSISGVLTAHSILGYNMSIMCFTMLSLARTGAVTFITKDTTAKSSPPIQKVGGKRHRRDQGSDLVIIFRLYVGSWQYGPGHLYPPRKCGEQEHAPMKVSQEAGGRMSCAPRSGQWPGISLASVWLSGSPTPCCSSQRVPSTWPSSPQTHFLVPKETPASNFLPENKLDCQRGRYSLRKKKKRRCCSSFLPHRQEGTLERRRPPPLQGPACFAPMKPLSGITHSR